jgi:hypothetical protein
MRNEIRLKVWVENGKIAVEFTDALGRTRGPLFFPPNAEKIEFWASIKHGVLYIQEGEKMHVYDGSTNEKIF